MIHRLLAIFAIASLIALAQPADDKPSIESLFRLPQYAQMNLSPDGEYIAALAPVAGRQNLVIINVATRAAQPVTTLTTRDVVAFSWLNSKRLLLQTGTLGTRDFDARGGGVFATDLDGSAARQLGEGRDANWRPLAMTEDEHALYVTTHKGRDKAAIMRYDPDSKSFDAVAAEHPQVDLTRLLQARGAVVGITYEADRGGAAWFDEGLA